MAQKNTGTEDVVFVSIVAPVPADYDPVSSNSTDSRGSRY